MFIFSLTLSELFVNIRTYAFGSLPLTGRAREGWNVQDISVFTSPSPNPSYDKEGNFFMFFVSFCILCYHMDVSEKRGLTPLEVRPPEADGSRLRRLTSKRGLDRFHLTGII